MSHHHDHHHHHHHHYHADNSSQVELDPATFSHLLFAKIITMVVLGVASFVLGILPIKLIRLLNKRNSSAVRKASMTMVTPCGAGSEHGHHHGGGDGQPLIVSMLLCFGGGVLLFTTFVHLGPEVRENMEDLMAKGVLPDYLNAADLHLADLIFCAGFFLVYFIDETVHSILHSRPPILEEEAVLHRTMSLRKCSRHTDFGHHHHHHHKGGTLIPRATLNSSATISMPDNSLLSVSTTSKQVLLAGENGTVNSGAAIGIPSATVRSDVPVRIPKLPSDGEQDDSSVSVDDEVSKSFRGLFAILALSFHEVFEGLAVGLETNVQNVWYLFAAIATHKLVISFCMGVDLVSTRTRIAVMIMYIFCFAIVTPIGIMIGILLLMRNDASSAEGTLLTFILQGLSSGTLLYVTFFEVLRRDKSNTKAGFLQLMAVITGFGLMLLLQILRAVGSPADDDTGPVA